MTSRAKSLFIFFFLISCTFMLLETDASRNKPSSYIPLCGSNTYCGGLWCPKKGGKYSCISMNCDIQEDCPKLVRCKNSPGPYCMEGFCTC
ncbi:hypothetical protein ISN45_At02g003850 [Arabidopsis thaliana x Arabidopsis arenosa]|uniref:Uncharacterized protein n=2 Tax=Arabidopsis TaxID=3701 RepID=A0A178VU49_ARATH|nr:hypothetical protein ISN45_At02g003850 [Arabidopsis thaliana x Arabidopsis arenosa]OAP09338.1 hypothetical protein AXX17_AT2G04130 [Arabidopsis thaliana]